MKCETSWEDCRNGNKIKAMYDTSNRKCWNVIN